VYHNDFPARRFFANTRGLYITEPMDEETARAKARNLMALGLEPPRFHLFARLAQDSLHSDSARLEQ
ncbi:VPS11, partial [Symbiodinium necroappetens]